MEQTIKQSLFPLGQVVATPGALAALEKAGQGPQEFLARHVSGDWGELSEDARKTNSAWSAGSGFSAAIAPMRARKFGLSPRRTAPQPAFFCRRTY